MIIITLKDVAFIVALLLIVLYLVIAYIFNKKRYK